MLVSERIHARGDGGSLLQSMYRLRQQQGCNFWHNSILSLMNLTSGVVAFATFRLISLGDVFR